ncbi:acyl-CoA dehydrogenase [Escherichia coli]|nr:acyl-CoA dehydrogenase [Escherichia coli]
MLVWARDPQPKGPKKACTLLVVYCSKPGIKIKPPGPYTTLTLAPN